VVISRLFHSELGRASTTTSVLTESVEVGREGKTRGHIEHSSPSFFASASVFPHPVDPSEWKAPQTDGRTRCHRFLLFLFYNESRLRIALRSFVPIYPWLLTASYSCQVLLRCLEIRHGCLRAGFFFFPFLDRRLWCQRFCPADENRGELRIAHCANKDWGPAVFPLFSRRLYLACSFASVTTGLGPPLWGLWPHFWPSPLYCFFLASRRFLCLCRDQCISPTCFSSRLRDSLRPFAMVFACFILPFLNPTNPEQGYLARFFFCSSGVGTSPFTCRPSEFPSAGLFLGCLISKINSVQLILRWYPSLLFQSPPEPPTLLVASPRRLLKHE